MFILLGRLPTGFMSPNLPISFFPWKFRNRMYNLVLWSCRSILWELGFTIEELRKSYWNRDPSHHSASHLWVFSSDWISLSPINFIKFRFNNYFCSITFIQLVSLKILVQFCITEFTLVGIFLGQLDPLIFMLFVDFLCRKTSCIINHNMPHIN